jgi:Pyruvate/2-oxoacid:ferredoxin oxidoreductase delta subunit
MTETVYKELLEVMKKRGGRWSGMDIPEFYDMVEELFTPEEAEVNNAFPRGPLTAKDLAKKMDRDETEIEKILEAMANKGLCQAVEFDGTIFYQGARFAIGILEFQFMPGDNSERAIKLAKLIHAYKEAYDAKAGPLQIPFPTTRVITVDRTIQPGNKVHTYDRVKTYIDKYDPIAVSSCYCRQEASLIGKDTHDMPMKVCMSFGLGALFSIQRLKARQLNKEEAIELLNQTEEAGLVHMTFNTTEDIEFLCNCDRWNCVVLDSVLNQPKPGLIFNSGFQPILNPETCISCETCIDRCPASARAMNDENNKPEVNFDRCFGCAVCVTGCPEDAIAMVAKPDFPEPPADGKALREAVKAANN